MDKPIKEPIDTIATIHIRYKSGDSRLTERVVSVTEFDSVTLFGLCHLRRNYRTFYFDRIRTCCDVATGEVVTNANGFLKDAYARSSWYSLDRISSTDMPILDILLYVAKADGQMRAPERKVITAAAKAFTHDVRITEEQVKWLLNKLDPVSLTSFRVEVGKISRLGDSVINRKLLAAARTIISTQKTVSPEEQEALDYLTRRLANQTHAPKPTDPMGLDSGA